MGLKEEVLEKVPSHLKKEPEVKVLLDYIKKEGLKEKEELNNFLKKEIGLVEGWLEGNKRKGGTIVKELRDKAIHLKVLKKCEKLVCGFLMSW